MYGFGVEGYSCIFFLRVSPLLPWILISKKKIASRKQLECKENDLKNQTSPKAV